MKNPADGAIPLRAMSDRQRRVVEENMGLVHLTLARRPAGLRGRSTGRERQDLQQEGCLALLDAVRSHDPVRHGSFAPYAMARIRFAVSRFAHENRGAIRVPFITQRRRRAAASADRHRPDGLPRLVPLTRDAPAARRPRRYVELDGVGAAATGPTIADLIAECYGIAADRVARSMKRSSGCAPGRSRLIDCCLGERWTIPEQEARTPIREIARRLGCSLGRVTHCEKRFRERLAAELLADRLLVALRAMASRREAGFRHRLTPDELEQLGPPAAARPERGTRHA